MLTTPLTHIGTMQPDDPIVYHFNLVSLSIAKIGRQFIEAAAMEKELREAGFVDVQIKAYRQPLGPWPKDCTLKHVVSLMDPPPTPRLTAGTQRIGGRANAPRARWSC